jgi:hypothetical protein
MSNPQTVDRNRSQHNRARKLLWPVAVAIFLFTVSYPANDFAPPPSPPDIGLGMLLVYAGIAAVTVGVVFAGMLPWAPDTEPNEPDRRWPTQGRSCSCPTLPNPLT